MIAVASAALASPMEEVDPAHRALVGAMAEARGLTPDQEAAALAVFARSDRIGQGLPAISVHPTTEAACRAAGVAWRDEEAERICGGLYMRPLYDPATGSPDDAKACIDTFEYPDVPCTFPVVWVRAVEAADLCAAEGKRLCDAHEWEGACQGAVRPPDYRFDLALGRSANDAVAAMRTAHNAAEAATKRWAYGPAWEAGRCAGASTKSAGCDGSDWRVCGSNTYPAGAFPECVSALGVADQHGNAAEHMNLPLAPDQVASTGSVGLGVTEMKGSWFIWDTYRAHEDWCRWRAPYWHGTTVRDPDSHRNYHLGFRCCKSLE